MATSSLHSLNTFALKASARAIVAVRKLEQLHACLPLSQPYLVLGGGSNLLFCGDFDGTVIHNQMRDIEYWQDEQNHYFNVAGGENWHQFVMYCANKGIGGLENLALIPGSVGAAPVQNIGAYGVELADVCESVKAIDLRTGKEVSFDRQQCQFAYRESIFKTNRDYFIHHVVFKLPKQWQAVLSYGELKAWSRELNSQPSPLAIANEVIKVRNNKLPDPNDIPNVGSFFKNPVVESSHAKQLKLSYPEMPQYEVGYNVKLAAGWLIDQLGLKGHQVGGAAVHERQALVLVNKNKATSRDVMDLAQHIIEQVDLKYGVKLEPEVNIIGHQGYGTLKEFAGE